MQILHEEKLWCISSIVPHKMSDGNDTLQDIYKFSSDIVRCPTVILSLVSPFLDVTRMSMSTLSFLVQLDSGILRL